MEFDGKDMHIAGWVHSEGGIWITADGSLPPQPNFTAEQGTMAFDPAWPPPTTRCEEHINPFNQVADFVPGHPDYLPEGTPPIDWPVWYTPSQFGWYQPAVLIPSTTRCRYKGTKIEVLSDKVLVDGSQPIGGVVVGGVIPDGIYCAREFVMNGSGVRFKGKITVVAEQITVNGDSTLGLELQPYAGSPDAVIFFTVPNTTGWPSSGSGVNTADDEQATLVCDHTKELQFNTYNSTWSGIVFNPCTRTSINQNNSTGSGAIVTKMLKVNGSGFDFTGKNNFSATVLLALVE
jgi:hypothetical protein